MSFFFFLLPYLFHLCVTVLQLDRLIFSGLTERPGELCYNFSISDDFTQMVSCSSWIPDCESQCPVLLNLFLSPDTSF